MYIQLARRLAKISNSPFIKVEATQYTEVGYHGKDVNMIIEDLGNHTAFKIRELFSNESIELSNQQKDLIDLFILDFLVGPNFTNNEMRALKQDNIKKGFYDDQFVNIEFPTFEKNKFNSLDEYLTHITFNKPTFDASNERSTVVVTKAKQLLFNYYYSKLRDKVQ